MPRIYKRTPDATVLIAAILEDEPPYEACEELDLRYGGGASDRLAEYFTASHASRDDMHRMAADETDLLVEIAKGKHRCQAMKVPGAPSYSTCRCGART